MRGTKFDTDNMDKAYFKTSSGLVPLDNLWNYIVGDNYNIKIVKKEDARKMVVSNKTKTAIKKSNGIIEVSKYENGEPYGNYAVMPDVLDVRTYNDDEGNPCATYLDFTDGTSTSAARRKDDAYSIEQGISICITKKLLDMLTNGAGNQVYNKLVRNAYKTMDNNNKAIEKMAREAEALEHKRAKLAEKKRRRDERRNAEAREELIEIQKEAILRALREHTISEDDLK